MITKKDFKKNVKLKPEISFHKDFRAIFNNEKIEYIVLSYTTKKKLKIVTDKNSYTFPIDTIQDDGFWVINKEKELETSWNIKFKDLNKFKKDE